MQETCVHLLNTIRYRHTVNECTTLSNQQYNDGDRLSIWLYNSRMVSIDMT